MITKELIEERINFLGYGNLKSKRWFIGMEEGFICDENWKQNLKKRFEATYGKEIVDSKDDMKDVPDHYKWHKENCKSTQNTYRKLIRILLILKDGEPNKEKILNFQKEKLGRLNGDHAILEFSPLPCNSSKGAWVYNDEKTFEKIDYIDKKEHYLEKIKDDRIKKFKERIEENKPDIVIFYSLGYKSYWFEIIGEDPFVSEEIGNTKIFYKRKNNTHFFIIPHPTARGIKNETWNCITKKIKDRLNMFIL